MPSLPRPLRLLAGATLPDGSVVDVTLDGDTVAAVTPAGPAPAPADEVLDLTGHLLLPAPADPHAHLDKALSWDAIQPPMGDLGLAIAAWRTFAETLTVDEVAERASRAALAMLANGTTAIRTHVDIHLGDAPLRATEALLRVREQLAGLMDIEIVALAGPEVPDASIEAALDAGVDLVGGAPHLAGDLAAQSADLRRLLSIAERRGVGVDLHADESLVHGDTLLEFARLTRGWSQNRSAGHCVRLGTLDATTRDLVIEEVRASDIGIIANPITNLYLQGWGDEVAMPRGLAPVRALLDAGIRVAAGADNVRDPFNPLGRSDALETAMLLVVAGHLTIDEAYAAVADGARSVLALPVAGPTVGAKAELLAIRATSLADAVANAPADRYVIHAGRLVAASSTTRTIAPLSPSPARKAS